MSAQLSIKSVWRNGIIKEEGQHVLKQVFAESDHLTSHFHLKGAPPFTFAAQWFFSLPVS